MPNSIKRDFVELERRRVKAARLLQKNVHAAEVARCVGVVESLAAVLSVALG